MVIFMYYDTHHDKNCSVMLEAFCFCSAISDSLKKNPQKNNPIQAAWSSGALMWWSKVGASELDGRSSDFVVILCFEMEASWVFQKMGRILMLRGFKQVADNCFQFNHEEQKKKLRYRVGTVAIGFRKANSYFKYTVMVTNFYFWSKIRTNAK